MRPVACSTPDDEAVMVAPAGVFTVMANSASVAPLLEREKFGDSRQPRKALHRHGEGKAGGKEGGGPQRHTDDKRRWADKNSSSIRSAGRVD